MNQPTSPRKTKPEIEAALGLGKSRTWTRVHRWRLQIIVGVVIAVALGLALIGGAGGSKSTIRYITAPVTRDDLTIIVTATGSVQPTNKVDISSELSGTIRKVFVDYNSQVKVDQVLAELDTDKLKASVENARAKLAAAKARVRDAEATVVEKKLEYEIKRKLLAKKFSSSLTMKAAKAAYQRALASVDSAKADVIAQAADLKFSETNLAKACICSPIAGVILKRNVEPGQIVASSLQAPVLFTIAEDLSKMEIQVDVDEADVGRAKVGQRATFTVDAYPDRRFSAKIRELYFGSEVVQGVVTYKAILSTDNSNLLLRPGMTATAEVTVRKLKAAVTVPNTALRFTPPVASESADTRSFLQKLLPGRPPFRPPSKQVADGPHRKIWLLVDGKPKQMAATIGLTDGKRTQILKGAIMPGQFVIVDSETARR